MHSIQVSSQEGMSRSKVKVSGMNRRQKIRGLLKKNKSNEQDVQVPEGRKAGAWFSKLDSVTLAKWPLS